MMKSKALLIDITKCADQPYLLPSSHGEWLPHIQAEWIEREPVVGMAPRRSSRYGGQAVKRRAPWPAARPPPWRKMRQSSNLFREDGNAPRSDAGWVRREINCTAGR